MIWVNHKKLAFRLFVRNVRILSLSRNKFTETARFTDDTCQKLFSVIKSTHS